ncbi:MAG: Bax inhibitor-1/YccA family protein [Acidimicrobiales bacterium]|nr:Bax inhibitor-1/YccA family protein [Acidimicrobiales bacterium]
MSNPLLSPDRFQPERSGPPTAWPDGSTGAAPGGNAAGPTPGFGSYGAPGTLGGPQGGHGSGYGAGPGPELGDAALGGHSPGYGTVPPAADNLPGSPWPPPPAGPGATETLRRGGVASATAVLLAIVAVAAMFGWRLVTLTTETSREVVDGVLQTVERTTVSSIQPWAFAGPILGLVIVIVCAFKPMWARFLAPVYAVGQGIFMGAVSHVFEASYPGIVVQAVALTFAVFLAMLGLYATGRIRVTPRFRLVVIAATIGVVLVYAVSIVLSLFGVDVPFIHDGGPIGIAFSLLVVGIAALNLALDFDFVDRAEQAGVPKALEWFAALGLVVTLVWLYLEILRLLAKIRNN